jgi:hypothetical protein
MFAVNGTIASTDAPGDNEVTQQSIVNPFCPELSTKRSIWAGSVDWDRRGACMAAIVVEFSTLKYPETDPEAPLRFGWNCFHPDDPKVDTSNMSASTLRLHSRRSPTRAGVPPVEELNLTEPPRPARGIGSSYVNVALWALI